MTKVNPCWSLETLLKDYDPHESWRHWFTEAYLKAMESPLPKVQLEGWRTAAIIFGDMHAPVFCLFACRHGQSMFPADSKAFFGNVNLCIWELGLATSLKPEKQDIAAESEWFTEQLQPFGGDVERAAVFAMRLTASRFGLLRGPLEPSIAQVLDESLWERT